MSINEVVSASLKTRLLKHPNPMESTLSMQQKTHFVIMNSIRGLKLSESKFRPTVTKAIMPDIPKYSTVEREEGELKLNAIKSAHWCALSKESVVTLKVVFLVRKFLQGVSLIP